jgi:hypothetical protein
MGYSKASAKGKAMTAYINNNKKKKPGKSQINDLMLHLNLLENLKQAKSKISRREIIKNKGQSHKIDTQKTIRRINATKSWFFEKIS